VLNKRTQIMAKSAKQLYNIRNETQFPPSNDTGHLCHELSVHTKRAVS